MVACGPGWRQRCVMGGSWRDGCQPISVLRNALQQALPSAAAGATRRRMSWPKRLRQLGCRRPQWWTPAAP
eukprot:11196036-Alexandrium_andersonii.AAC.1